MTAAELAAFAPPVLRIRMHLQDNKGIHSNHSPPCPFCYLFVEIPFLPADDEDGGNKRYHAGHNVSGEI